jgi:DNA polymerase V
MLAAKELLTRSKKFKQTEMRSHQSNFEFLPENFSLDEFLSLNNPSSSIIRQKGEAMHPRIHNGDLMVVNRSLKANPGDIVVALVHGQFCVRRFIPHENQGEVYVELMADQEKYRTYHLGPGIPFEIWGVVTHVLGKLP